MVNCFTAGHASLRNSIQIKVFFSIENFHEKNWKVYRIHKTYAMYFLGNVGKVLDSVDVAVVGHVLKLLKPYWWLTSFKSNVRRNGLFCIFTVVARSALLSTVVVQSSLFAWWLLGKLCPNVGLVCILNLHSKKDKGGENERRRHWEWYTT